MYISVSVLSCHLKTKKHHDTPQPTFGAIKRKQIRGNELYLSKILNGRLDLLAALDVARPPEPVIVVEVVGQVLQENVKRR